MSGADFNPYCFVVVHTWKKLRDKNSVKTKNGGDEREKKKVP